MSLNILLMSDEMIKERSAIHGNTDAKLMYPDIKLAQDRYILPIIGTALYNKLQTAVNANDWTGITDYKNLLDNYIVDALMYFTMSELPFTLGYQFWNKGIVRKLGENTEAPSMSELVDISNRYRDKAQWYANRLKNYLRANTNLFSEYLNPGNALDTINPESSAYNIPIYLGPDSGECNPGGFTGQPYND